MSNFLYGIPPLITSSLVFVFGVMSFTKKPYSINNRIFSYFCFSVTVWALFYGILYMCPPENCVFLARIAYIGVVFIPAFAFHFTLLAANIANKKIIFYVYVLSLFFLPISQTRIFLNGYYLYFWGPYPKAGPAYIFFVIYFVSSFLLSVFMFFRSYKRRLSSIEYNQAKFLFLAYALASTSIVDYIPNYGIEIYPFAYISTFGWISIIAYATLRYKLMDFNLILRWGIAYFFAFSISVVSFSVFLFVIGRMFERFFGFRIEGAILISLCFIAYIFDHLKISMHKFVDRIIFKSPDLKILIDGITLELSNADSLVDIAPKIISKIRAIWNIDHAGLVMWDPGLSKFKLFPEEHFKNQIIVRFKSEIHQTDFLIKTLETERRLFKYGIIVEDELTALGNKAFPGERITFWKIRRTMRWLGANICIPLMSKKQLIGIIALGPKNNKALYNDEDKKFLSHLSEQISICIDLVGTNKAVNLAV